MHVVCIKNSKSWDYSFYVYDDKQNEIENGVYSGDNGNHIKNLIDNFAIK